MLKTMYKGKAFSPRTFLSQSIGVLDTQITVDDASVLPAPPNRLTIWDIDNNKAEVVNYTGINGNIVVGLTRGVDGEPKEFDNTAVVFRAFAEVDYSTLIDNVKGLDSDPRMSDSRPSNDVKSWAKKDVGTALKTDGDVLSAKIATQAESETATADNVLMSPLKTKQEISKLLPLTSIGTLPTVTNIPVATNDPLNTAIAKLQKQTSNIYPTGGADGQILIKDGAVDQAVKYSTEKITDLATKDETDELTKRIEQLEFKSPKIYGIRWDGVSSQCKRLYDAENISVNVANFCHRGSVNASYSNPFDNIMPWKGRKVCNVDLGLYQALQSGDNIKDCVTAWEGYPNFKWDGSNGEVMVYTPEFWTKQTQQSGAWDILISDSPIAGWNHIAQSIGGRWFAIDDGTGSLSSKAGMPLTNVAMSTLHAKAKTKGMTVENIYIYSAENVLFAVEYATLNSQEGIGSGDDSSYRQSSDKPSFAETSANRVIVTNAIADFYTVNCTLDIGTSNGANNIARRTLLSKTAHTTAGYTCLNFDGAPVNITTAQFISAHGIVNTTDSQIGSKSGYLGANGKSHAYYRGRISHVGRFRYILGAYRQKDTGRIWLSPPHDCDNYDALDVEKHQDTGFTLPYNMSTGAAVGGYIKTLAPINDVALAPVCTAIGGSTSNPVGDYCYMPTLAAVNTVLLVSGNASSGVGAGRFCGYWAVAAGDGLWNTAVLPFLKNP